MTTLLQRRREARMVKLVRFIASADVCPSYRQIMRHLKTKSPGRVHEAINYIEAKGWIRRLPYRARAIEVVQPLYFVWDNNMKMLVPRLENADSVPANPIEAAE